MATLPGYSFLEGYVYFIEALGTKRIKIGWSLNPLSRVEELATASPFPLELIRVIYGDRRTEQWWHQKFENSRVHREWFRATPKLRNAITDPRPLW